MRAVLTRLGRVGEINWFQNSDGGCSANHLASLNHVHRLALWTIELLQKGVGFPTPGQFVEGDDFQAEGFLHEPFDVDAAATHALRAFGECAGGDSFQFEEPEFPNLWAFSCIGHF